MPSDQPYYDDYLPPKLVAKLDADAVPVPGVPGLRQNAQLAAAFPQIDTPEALRFVVGVYEDVADELRAVLALRARDREFIDTYTAAAVARNRDSGAGYLSAGYDTVIGAVNPADGRIVVGPDSASGGGSGGGGGGSGGSGDGDSGLGGPSDAPRGKAERVSGRGGVKGSGRDGRGDREDRSGGYGSQSAPGEAGQVNFEATGKERISGEVPAMLRCFGQGKIHHAYYYAF